MRKLFCGFLTICIFLVFTGCEQRNDISSNDKYYVSNEASFELPPYVAVPIINDINEETNIDIQTAEDKKIHIEILKSIYSLQDDVIRYSIINNTGEDKWVVLVPLLERETINGWEKVLPVGIGFCGTPDQINTIHNGELPLSWYTNMLTAGLYRLSFNVVNFNDYDTIEILSDTFELTDFDVIVEVKKHQFDSKSAALAITNNSEREYTFGEHYTIQRKGEYGWEEVDTIEAPIFYDIGYGLRAMQTTVIDVEWEWLYGELVPGEYRITKTFDYIRSPGDYDNHHVSAEFIIEM